MVHKFFGLSLKCTFEGKFKLTGFELKENETPKFDCLQVTEVCLVKRAKVVRIARESWR